MKKLLLLILHFAFCILNSFSQTNVSGGIYANTTWTLANSPYIVVDTVVVFPGVTLTIDPGVVVKFDNNKRLDIRGYLVAQGTVTDSITFTSNSGTPTPGIYAGIYMDNVSNPVYKYCNFLYAKCGITGSYNSFSGSMIIKHCSFLDNLTGAESSQSNFTVTVSVDSCTFSYNTNVGCKLVRGAGNLTATVNHSFFSYNGNGILPAASAGDPQGFLITNCTFRNNVNGVAGNHSIISNCVINSNQTGIPSSGYNTFMFCAIDSNIVKGVVLDFRDTIINCEINYNDIGMDIPVQAGGGPTRIIQNIIENNNTGVNSAMRLGTWPISFYCNKLCNNGNYDVYYTNTNNTSISNNYWCTTDTNSIATRIYDGYEDASYGLVSVSPVDVNNCYLTGCNLTVNANVTNATCDTCHTGSATANVTYGFPPYSYTWYTTPIQTTQTATALASGTYTVCVTDGHGCTACNYNVFVDSTNCTGFAINTTSTNASCSACSDGTATVNTTNGNAPFTYTWYTSPIQTTQTATGLPLGSYAVCVNDVYGCTLCDTVTIGVGSCSAYYTIAAAGPPHAYDLTNMASGTPPLSYDWDWGDASAHDNTPYPSHTYAGAGNYTICLSIIDFVGCTDTYCHGFYLLEEFNATPVTVNVIPPTTTGIAEANAKSFSIYPNPTKSFLTIKSPQPIDNISIYSMDGRITKSLVPAKRDFAPININVSDLSVGIYFIEVNKTSRQRFVKQ
jgi:hypothetical protein